jgi:hypothetical protein
MEGLIKYENEILCSKEDYGVSYCGGGLRSCVLTYGCMSGMKDFMNKIKYISGVSGATWFIIGYTYYNDQMIFDKYQSPENCTLENLNFNDKNTFGYILDKVNFVVDMIETFSFYFFSDIKINRWNTIIYESFFKQYDDNKIKWDFNKKVPYPLINASISYNAVNENIFPIEFTPHYASVPVYHKKNDTEYGGYNIKIEECCSNYELVPYIQSGLSSSFLESGKEFITDGSYSGTEYELFNLNTKKNNSANLVDGGLYDNSGINGLLRRKVKNIHLNIFPNGPITDENFMYKANYFTSLFIGNPESDKHGIFSLGLWESVYEQLLYKLDEGLPLTIMMTTDVKSNPYFQIDGYENVNFLFHISSCSHEWFNKLPDETKTYINKEIPTFPYIKTTKYKFNRIEINLLYNYAMYDTQNSAEYKKFYNIETMN